MGNYRKLYPGGWLSLRITFLKFHRFSTCLASTVELENSTDIFVSLQSRMYDLLINVYDIATF